MAFHQPILKHAAPLLHVRYHDASIILLLNCAGYDWVMPTHPATRKGTMTVRIYADFNDQDELGRVWLNTGDSLEDTER